MVRRNSRFPTAVILTLVILLTLYYRNEAPDPVSQTYEPNHEPPKEAANVEHLINAGKPGTRDSPTYIFAFGDSYTTYGFESEGSVPSVLNPLGNRATNETVPDQPATYTPKWLDFLINELSPPQTLAFNYARGASTVDGSLIPPTFWGAKALVDQGIEFLTTVGDPSHKMHVDWHADNSAVIIWFGINDASNTAEQVDLDHVALYRRVAQSYTRTMESFYKAGARRFLLLGLPPLDRTPSLIHMGAPSTFSIATAVTSFNSVLVNYTMDWAETHKSTFVRFLDTQPTYHRILDADPKNSKCTIRERPSCMWVDIFHPSVQLQRGVGEDVARILRTSLLWS